MSEVYLPGELLNMTVGYLSDCSDLKTCTLLSRHWRTAARPVLFRSVTVRVATETSGGAGKIDDAPPSRSLQAFREFLSTHDAYNVASCIIKLLVAQPSGGDQAVLDLRELDLVLTRLPALDELHMSIAIIGPCPSGSSLNGWTNPKSLKVLSLGETFLSLSSPPERQSEQCCLVSLLNLFGSVATLSLNTLWLEEPEKWIQPEYIKAAGRSILPTFRLGEIRSEVGRAHASHDNLLVILAESGLRDLWRVKMKDRGSTNSKFFRALGHQITHLHLTINGSHGYTTEMRRQIEVFFVHLCRSVLHQKAPVLTSCFVCQDTYSIACCTALVSLQVSVIRVTENTGPSQAHMQSLVTHLPTGLRELTLKLHYWGHDCTFLTVLPRRRRSLLENLDWKKMGTSIAALEALESVAFVFRRRYVGHASATTLVEDPNFDWETKTIKERLPLLTVKNLLKFSESFTHARLKRNYSHLHRRCPSPWLILMYDQ